MSWRRKSRSPEWWPSPQRQLSLRGFLRISTRVEILCYALCEARYVWFHLLSGRLVAGWTPAGRGLAPSPAGLFRGRTTYGFPPTNPLFPQRCRSTPQQVRGSRRLLTVFRFTLRAGTSSFPALLKDFFKGSLCDSFGFVGTTDFPRQEIYP